MRNNDSQTKSKDTRLEKLQQYNQQSLKRLRNLVRNYEATIRRFNQRSG